MTNVASGDVLIEALSRITALTPRFPPSVEQSGGNAESEVGFAKILFTGPSKANLSDVKWSWSSRSGACLVKIDPAASADLASQH